MYVTWGGGSGKFVVPHFSVPTHAETMKFGTIVCNQWLIWFQKKKIQKMHILANFNADVIKIWNFYDFYLVQLYWCYIQPKLDDCHKLYFNMFLKPQIKSKNYNRRFSLIFLICLAFYFSKFSLFPKNHVIIVYVTFIDQDGRLMVQITKYSQIDIISRYCFCGNTK